MKKLNKNTGVALVLPLVTLFGCGTQEKNQKPNVILILADDLGYSGISAFGGIELTTPTLDKLALEGVVCSNFHTNAPVSSPTRVSILTGSYQQRAGLNTIYAATGGETEGLDPTNNPSFVIQLQNAGYNTGMYGKWHLGMDPKFSPNNHGFDDWRGFLIGNIDLVSHRDRFNKIDWWHNGEIVEEEGYGTHLLTNYAVEFIKENKDNPFFLYFPQGAIHTPIVAPGDPPVRDGINPPAYDNAATMEVAEYQRRYREMVKSIDDGLNLIIEELKKQDILDNTMIIFLSDNGAESVAANKYPGANGYFNGAKSTLYEGGIRVPAIFYYPKSIQHYRSDELMMSMDLMPTILEFCGIVNSETIDGVSLLPTLVDKKPMPTRDIFWSNQGWMAMQSGDWKLVRQRDKTELFNMMIDPKEQHDLSTTFPERTAEMTITSDNWWKDVTSGTKLEGTSTFASNMVGGQINSQNGNR